MSMTPEKIVVLHERIAVIETKLDHISDVVDTIAASERSQSDWIARGVAILAAIVGIKTGINQ